MGLSETLLLYLVVGLAVAAAVYLTGEGGLGWRGWLGLAPATVFWPLYLPIVLSRPNNPGQPPAARPRGTPDEMAEAIAQVDAELDTALSSLDGWAENVLAREKERLVELRSALAAQAARIREIDALMARSEENNGSESPVCRAAGEGLKVDRRSSSEQARRKNLERLREVRRRSYDDLMGTLAWIRELVSMIHLAKFTGAPAARAEELVAQIAAAVEGISAVTWQDGATDEGSEVTARANSPAA
jgi:hypothetical protein